MGGKHLKRLRSEKAKVQLKKKKLPKGHNITDASFKVKKIAIVEQLAQREVGIPVTSRNLSLKELLNQLSHHNINTQVKALHGIKELFNNNPQLANGLSLRQVVTRVLEVSVDERERKVRREAIKLLKRIFNSIPLGLRAPFTDLFHKQVKRGLTHIHSGTQSDSLKLVDLLLVMIPIQDRHRLYPLINLLVRMLTMSGTNAPARHIVLRRLFSVCKAVFSSRNETSTPFTKEADCTTTMTYLTSYYKTIPRLPLMSTIETSFWDNDVLRTTIESVMKVLSGVWMECSTDDYLVDSSAMLLKILVQIILVFTSLVSNFDNGSLKQWFTSNFSKSTGKIYFRYFPYLSQGTISRGRQPDPDIDDDNISDSLEDLVVLNLGLAHLYYWFKLKLKNIELKIEKYIVDCMDLRPVPEEMPLLLNTLLSVQSKRAATIESLATSFISSPDLKLLPLLNTIVNKPNLYNFICDQHVEKWIVSLANNLSNAPIDYINILVTIVTRYDIPALSDVVRNNAKAVLTKNMSLDSNFKNLIHILYWCCSSAYLQTIVSSINCSTSVKDYLNNILCS